MARTPANAWPLELVPKGEGGGQVSIFLVNLMRLKADDVCPALLLWLLAVPFLLQLPNFSSPIRLCFSCNHGYSQEVARSWPDK